MTMSFFNGLAGDERSDLYELVNVLIERIDVQRRLNEDLVRKLNAAEARLQVLDVANYGAF
jgi:hypothetical protein